MNNIKY